MNKEGTLLATIPITDSLSGAGLTMDEMAWDNGRKVFWIQLHNSNPVEVYKLDPTTGVATHAFTSATISQGSYRDGIAYDASDDSLWISGDVSTTIEHYRACDGALINTITPKNSGGSNLGTISGVNVGVGDLLYLGRNGQTQIVQVKKSDGSFIGSFASPGGARDEGLECDAVNFAPTLVLWSRDVNNFVVAIELEPGTCECQSPCPDDIVTCNDPGECGAIVEFTPNAENTTCNPPSGSFFPVGTTVVTCTTTHPECEDIPDSTCSFTVTVQDREPPVVECYETVNPHGNKIPPAGSTTLPGPKGGKNEDGFYTFEGSDNCDSPEEIAFFVKDLGSDTLFGPFSSGDVIKYTQDADAVPESKSMGSSKGQAGAVAAHIIGNGDGAVVAVDTEDNVSEFGCLLVPEPPK